MMCDKLYEVVCAHPGETMQRLSPKVGETAQTLQVPIARLKKEGRIRTVGNRQFTSYFPMARAEAP